MKKIEVTIKEKIAIVKLVDAENLSNIKGLDVDALGQSRGGGGWGEEGLALFSHQFAFVKVHVEL